MAKINIDLRDEKTREMWNAIQRATQEVENWPDWKRGDDVGRQRRQRSRSANGKETRDYWQERALAVENTLRLLIYLMHEQHGLNFDRALNCLNARIDHINTQFEAGRRQWTDEEVVRQQATGKLDL